MDKFKSDKINEILVNLNTYRIADSNPKCDTFVVS